MPVFEYAHETGQMEAIYTNTIAGGNQRHRIEYDYDGFGNLSSQTVEMMEGIDVITSIETYGYDDLHRLISSGRTIAGAVQPTINYNYDAVGNLILKDDYASAYVYGDMTKSAGNAGTNAVRSITKAGGGTATFSYDLNGNLTSGDGKTITYNAFNKPVIISKSGITSNFRYGADQLRYKQIKTGLPNGTETTIYIDKTYEEVSYNGETKKRVYLGDAIITEAIGGAEAGHKIGFVHRDRLGSVVTITDENGNVVENKSYDPFGKPRKGTMDLVEPPTLKDVALASNFSLYTNRGFTDHEHLDDAELIHMNGRVYDYNLGRFLSVDPFIQSPGNSQSMNPYSYIMNNPLAGTDPSGYVANIIITCGEGGGKVCPNPDENTPVGGSGSEDGSQGGSSNGSGDSSGSGAGGETDNGGDGEITITRDGPEVIPEEIESLPSSTPTRNTNNYSGTTITDRFDIENFIREAGSGGSNQRTSSNGGLKSELPPSQEKHKQQNSQFEPRSESLLSKLRLNNIGHDVWRVIYELPPVVAASGNIAKSSGFFAKLFSSIFKGGCSFVSGTLVATADGYIPIEELKEGDLILSKSDVTGEQSEKPINAVFVEEHDQVYKFVFTKEDGSLEKLVTTAEHPFMIFGKDWHPASELRIGDLIETLKESYLTLKQIDIVEQKQFAYNFEVDEFRAYSVTESQLWVHNTCQKIIAGTQGLLHSFDRHAGEWFGRTVSKTTHVPEWQSLIEITSKSKLSFAWQAGSSKTTAFLSRIDNKPFLVQFFRVGPRKGEIATAFVPNSSQMNQINRILHGSN